MVSFDDVDDSPMFRKLRLRIKCDEPELYPDVIYELLIDQYSRVYYNDKKNRKLKALRCKVCNSSVSYFENVGIACTDDYTHTPLPPGAKRVGKVTDYGT